MNSKTRAIIFAIIVLLPAITFAKTKSKDTISELCLAKTIYYECRSCENKAEKIDIAKIVINRTLHKEKFSDTICGVINQKNQFKWVKHLKSKIKDEDSWNESLEIAKQILANPNISKLSDNVVFFKTKKSKVKLANNITRVKFNDIRNHVFFKMNG